jgi:hypothetical protein
MSPTPAPAKSVKLPDAPILTDGKDPRIEDWILLVRNKLRGNADHYPSADLRKAYVVGRCGGDAMKHASPQMRPGAINEYINYKDILSHLDSVFGDPHRVMNAKRKYHALRMQSMNQFQNFLSEFLYLAGEAGISSDDLKQDLFEKLTPKMKEMVMGTTGDPNLSFKSLQDQCTFAANQASAWQSETRSRFTPRAGTNAPNNRVTNPSTTTTSRTATVKREQSQSSNADAERERLMREGRCFTCKQPGHLSRNCSKKANDVKNLENLERVTEVNSESEN